MGGLPRAWIAAAVVADIIHCCGGHDAREEIDMVEHFSVTDESWISRPPMCQRRAGGVAAVAANCLHVCGGYDGSQPLSSLERCESTSGTWSLLLPMALARTVSAAAVVSGRILVFGGESAERRAIDSVECYDPSAGVWSPGPPTL